MLLKKSQPNHKKDCLLYFLVILCYELMTDISKTKYKANDPLLSKVEYTTANHDVHFFPPITSTIFRITIIGPDHICLELVF